MLLFRYYLFLLSLLLIGNEAKTKWGDCTDRNCLLDEGCVRLYELTGGDMEPIVSKEKCINSLNSFHEYRLCWQSEKEKQQQQQRQEYRLKPSTIPPRIETHMKHGFDMNPWLIDYSSFDKENEIPGSPSSPFLVTQICTVINEPDREHDCYLNIKPGGGVSQSYIPLYGNFVAYWKQGVIKGTKNSGTGNFRLSIEKHPALPTGNSTPTIIHEHYESIITDIKYSIFQPQWTEMIHHFELPHPSPIQQEPNIYNGEAIEEYDLQQAEEEESFILKLKLENLSYNPNTVSVDDMEIYMCPSNYWNVEATTTTIKRKKDGDDDENDGRNLDCSTYNPGTTCLCHNVKSRDSSNNDVSKYVKICISNSAVATHIRHGDFLPGTVHQGTLYDCKCVSLGGGVPVPAPVPVPVPVPVSITNENTGPQPEIALTNSSSTLPGTNTTTTVTNNTLPQNTTIITTNTTTNTLPTFQCPSELKMLFICRDFSRTHPDMMYRNTGLDEKIVLNYIDPSHGRRPYWNAEAPLNSHPSVTDKDNFNSWFTNGPEVLVTKWIHLLSYGNWTFGGPGFFPFDKPEAKQKEGEEHHNYYFTCEHHGRVYYNSSMDQYITVTSSDDAWLFVNDLLVIDLGGVHKPLTKTIFLNSLGLTNGKNYNLDLFYANRYPPESSFQIDSNSCFYCNDSEVDICGVCGGKGDSCSLKDDSERKKSETKNVKDGDEHSPCGGSNTTDCDKIHLFADFQENIYCSVTEVGSKLYRFDFNVELEYPYNIPSAVTIGLSGYNYNIRSRGSCDNLLSNPSSNWADVNTLWNPDLVTNKPLWTKDSSFSASGTKKKIKYSTTISSEGLMYCVDPDGIGDLVNRHFDNSTYSYSGMWFVTRSSPDTVENEVRGENMLYSFVCSFKIHESSVGVSALSYSGGKSDDDDEDDVEDGDIVDDDKDNKDISVDTTWIKTYCNPGDDNMVIILQTCSHLIQSPGWWVKLNNPRIHFQNGTSQFAYNDTFSISLLSNSNENDDCVLTDKSWRCCQRWLLVTKPSIIPPVKGTLQVVWDALIYKLTHKLIGDDKTYFTQRLCSSMSVNINNGCSDIVDIICENNRCSGNNNNTEDSDYSLKGGLVLYKDPLFTTPWNIDDDEPFFDGDVVYGNLIPDLDKNTCKLYNISITDISIFVYPKKNHYQPNKKAKITNETTNPCFTLAEYHQGNTVLNQLRGSWVINNPNFECYSNFSWIVKRIQCPSNHKPRKHASSWNNDNGGDDSMLKDGDIEFTMKWDPEQKKWIYPDSVADKKRDLSSQREESDFSVIISVTWELIPLSFSDDKKRFVTSITQSDYDGDDDEDDRPRLRNHDFIRDTRTRFSVQCKQHQEWDPVHNYCHTTGLHWWIPKVDYGFLWIIVALFAVFVLVIVSCMLCGSIANVRDALEDKKHKTIAGDKKVEQHQFYHKIVNSWPLSSVYYYISKNNKQVKEKEIDSDDDNEKRYKKQEAFRKLDSTISTSVASADTARERKSAVVFPMEFQTFD